MMGEGAAICGDSFRVEWILIDSMFLTDHKKPGLAPRHPKVCISGRIHLGEIGRGVYHLEVLLT